MGIKDSGNFRSAFLLIPISDGFIEYEGKYQELIEEYSEGPADSNGMVSLNPDLAFMFREKLVALNTEYKKDIMFRDEQMQSILN